MPQKNIVERDQAQRTESKEERNKTRRTPIKIKITGKKPKDNKATQVRQDKTKTTQQKSTKSI
jgi:hypothetical protein